jgi:hypothetical protein
MACDTNWPEHTFVRVFRPIGDWAPTVNGAHPVVADFTRIELDTLIRALQFEADAYGRRGRPASR